MSDQAPISLTARIAAVRRSLNAIPLAMTQPAVAAAIQQIQSELSQVFVWSQDMERYVSLFERQIGELQQAMTDLMDARTEAPSALGLIDEMLQARANKGGS